MVFDDYKRSIHIKALHCVHIQSINQIYLLKQQAASETKFHPAGRPWSHALLSHNYKNK